MDHDLSKGIPFESDSVDAVCHSHVLEHLDRPVAGAFLKETLRVLKPGGIYRIVVPDFEFLCREDVMHFDRRQCEPWKLPATKTSPPACSSSPSGAKLQPRPVARALRQSVSGIASPPNLRGWSVAWWFHPPAPALVLGSWFMRLRPRQPSQPTGCYLDASRATPLPKRRKPRSEQIQSSARPSFQAVSCEVCRPNFCKPSIGYRVRVPWSS
jgi:hypothetical protein